MDHTIVNLPEIAVIGKEGLCTKENNVVSNLWADANAHFEEVASLAMKEKDGSLVGLWGAMSDESKSFLPWTEGFSRGLYLAGVEVVHEAEAPSGWVKWVIPARSYYVTVVDDAHYAAIFTETIQTTLPQKGLRLSGAVMDHTKPSEGKSYLFFPVEKED